MGRKKLGHWSVTALLLLPVLLLISMQGAAQVQGTGVDNFNTEDPTPVPDDLEEPPPPDETSTGPVIDWANVTNPGMDQLGQTVGNPALVREASPALQPQPAPQIGPAQPPSSVEAPAPIPNPDAGDGSTASSVDQSAGAQTTYVIQHGDSLYTISLHFGVPQNVLAAANNITWWDYIYAGQEMIIPAGANSAQNSEQPAAQSNAAPAPAAQPVSDLSGPTTYIVQRGDSLGTISGRFAVDITALIVANNITNPNFIWAGQALIIPAGGAVLTADSVASPAPAEEQAQEAAPAEQPETEAVSDDPGIHIVQRGDSLVQIARLYGVDVMSLITTNNLTNPNHIYPGQQIIIPGATEKPAPDVAQVLAEVLTEATESSEVSRFIWPVENYRIVRWFSYYHPGIDLIVDVGTPVVAAAAGEVEFADWNQYGYGYAVIIHHGGGVRSLYAHNSELLVSQGDHVEQGQTIALSGSTGWSNWPHVHLEIIYYERIRQNPCDYLPGGC